MTFLETDIKGCYTFCYDKNEDERGNFVRLLCKRDLLAMGIDFDVKQSNLATNLKKKTARGLHYQAGKHAENKIIVCTSGVIDVVVHQVEGKESDTIVKRLDSNLSSIEAIFVPKNCASGYITIEDNSQVLYYMDQYYFPSSQKVISLVSEDVGHDLSDAIISERDAIFRSIE